VVPVRATVDLDDPTDMDILKAWNRLADHGDGEVYGRVSSSGEGVHLKVHGCDEDTVERLRRLCGDDVKRRDFDAKTRLKPKQILFSSKPGQDGAGEWTTDMDRVVSEYRRRCPVETRQPELARRYRR
jgi:hypothetical protein